MTIKLYQPGEMGYLPCGCIWLKEEKGFTYYINPECKYDNKIHPVGNWIQGQYERAKELLKEGKDDHQ